MNTKRTLLISTLVGLLVACSPDTPEQSSAVSTPTVSTRTVPTQIVPTQADVTEAAVTEAAATEAAAIEVIAIATAEPTAITIPQEPVEHNADWTPAIQSFNGIDMVLVPPGCFTMGNDDGRRDERPANQVCFDQAFWIDKTEVTNAEYGSEGHFSGANRPHENLLWSEARDFCVAQGGRLPTEAEWEYAARGPDSLIYPWGDELISQNLVFDRNTPGDTADVGSRPSGASWVGALDMSGNVFEWTNSIYARYPYDASDGREDPNDTTSPRVYRGGNQSYIDYGVAASTRFRLNPTDRDWFLGFRCARDVTASP